MRRFLALAGGSRKCIFIGLRTRCHRSWLQSCISLYNTFTLIMCVVRCIPPQIEQLSLNRLFTRNLQGILEHPSNSKKIKTFKRNYWAFIKFQAWKVSFKTRFLDLDTSTMHFYYLLFTQLLHNINTLIAYNYIWFAATCFDVNTSSSGSFRKLPEDDVLTSKHVGANHM